MPYKLFLQFILPGNIQKWPLKSDVLTKNPLLFPELPIYLSLFSRCTILFPEISLLFSRSTFLFSRCAFSFLRLTLLFSSIWLQFSRSVFFLFTVHVFFPRMLFSSWLYFILARLTTAERYNVCLALVLFPLGALCWPTYDAFLKTLKSPHGVWSFCLFYSDFSINFNFENADIFWIQAFVLSRHCFDQDISLIQIWFSISTARKAKCVCIQYCLSSRIPDIFEWRWI